MTLFELHQKLVNKEISALELAKAVLAHKDNVEPTVHAYLSDSHEEALAQAEAVDAKIAKGEFQGRLRIIFVQKEWLLLVDPICWKTLCHLTMQQLSKNYNLKMQLSWVN